jgi:superfamily I DNA and/or RNA helicase
VEDAQRLNVAITRARRSLWLLGCARALQESPLWAQLLRHASDTGSLLRH